MNQPTPNMDPFTEDQTKKHLIEYAKFTKSAYTPMFCEHKVTDSKMHVAGDGFNTKGNIICLTSEKREEGEGLIYQKDLYTFCQNFLGKESQDRKEGEKHDTDESQDNKEEKNKDTEKNQDDTESPNRRGYWMIEVTDQDISSPLPVFQFGTLGLEVYPSNKGIIRLGSWDIELILRTCTHFKQGRTIMPKVSGSAISDGNIRFRWCLRGPKNADDLNADDTRGLFKKEKFKSLLRKADFRK